MKVLDVVALTHDHQEASLQRGQVGTIIETLATGRVRSRIRGSRRTYGMLALPAEHLIILHHRLTKSAA